MSKINKVKCQMLKINKINFDGAYLRSSSGHFYFKRALPILGVGGVDPCPDLSLLLRSPKEKALLEGIFKERH